MQTVNELYSPMAELARKMDQPKAECAYNNNNNIAKKYGDFYHSTLSGIYLSVSFCFCYSKTLSAE